MKKVTLGSKVKIEWEAAEDDGLKLIKKKSKTRPTYRITDNRGKEMIVSKDKEFEVIMYEVSTVRDIVRLADPKDNRKAFDFSISEFMAYATPTTV